MGSYKSCQASGGGGSSSSTETNTSDHSKSTAPTIVSNTAKQQDNDWPDFDSNQIQVEIEDDSDEDPFIPTHSINTDKDHEADPHTSSTTYASTTRSEHARKVEEEEEEQYNYSVNDREESFPTDALASTPSSFAGLFPSTRRLLIRHDDATIDGNMNLRVDTLVPCRAGYQQDVILFHLRMYDLFSRKFSFRRYCRDSGREVCHSSRKEASSPDRRRKSWSSVLASLRPGSSAQHSHDLRIKRQDSGYEAAPPPSRSHCHSSPCYSRPGEEEEGEEEEERHPLTETILLEFSNYAHVELRRKGTGTTKYEYEYWSTKYQWRRETRREGDLREVSFYLVDMRSSKTVAHLVPEILTPLEAVEEESKGGWVPPCSLWISEMSVYEKMPDVADVIVATGLVALVDDCIRRRWHSRRTPWSHPTRTLTRRLERMGPRLIGALQRRGSA
ncbi:hypothetical protein N7532_009201 [Penicillium argentinense]|uniref:Uncharacterized protein n=1 Tax=Penicillium argentinense TaxID=1131581 RepID=A0A9W9EYX3_9EURO|nr:uncharacterized protein N7532_009201 [Penicillium argentinense]KAJ5090517.1 hypothetical protein N7532_009201 [Penicillium argentinense]